MQVLHAPGALSALFDDPNLVSCAGLAPLVALAARAGLPELATRHLRVPGQQGANPGLKVPALVAGMVAGADSINDMDLLRHGGMGRLFRGVRAPSTLGIFLRGFTFGHVRQLDAVASRFLPRLAGQAPILAEAEQIAWLDIDDTVIQTYGYAKQAADRGYTGVKGLNALVATVSTALAAPVIAATRLRRGNARSSRGAASLVAEALQVARRCGAGGLIILRADAAFYTRAVAAAAQKAGARFNITAPLYTSVTKAIAAIPEGAWTPIRYPEAIFDEAEQRWISDAEVAEISFAAFRAHRHRLDDQITGRLIVRRVRRLNPRQAAGQDELFPGYRHHAIFTDSPLPMLQAEAQHRRHAIIEQVFADLKAGPLAHLPSGRFAANSAWLVLAAMAFNLTRAAGVLASLLHTKATTGAIRRQLIMVPARLAYSARRLRLHLPARWPWQPAWQQLFAQACAPPTPASH
jgi:Transposase DDE domain group 1